MTGKGGWGLTSMPGAGLPHGVFPEQKTEQQSLTQGTAHPWLGA